MPDFASRGMQLDLKAVFISPITGNPADPISPTVEIVHYIGVTEIIDLPETSMEKVKDGHYIYNWTVPPTFPINETAFIYFRGTDENGHRAPQQTTYRIVDESFFNGSSGSSGLVVKFTKD